MSVGTVVLGAEGRWKGGTVGGAVHALGHAGGYGTRPLARKGGGKQYKCDGIVTTDVSDFVTFSLKKFFGKSPDRIMETEHASTNTKIK